MATVLDEAPGDVVAEPLPGFLFGVARRQPVPGLVEELACQWGTGCTVLRRASPWFGSPCLQLRLDRVPELRSNDRWMLALVDMPLVPDAAGVERIGQQAVEVCPRRNGSPPVRVPSAAKRCLVRSLRRSASAFTCRRVPCFRYSA